MHSKKYGCRWQSTQAPEKRLRRSQISKKQIERGHEPRRVGGTKGLYDTCIYLSRLPCRKDAMISGLPWRRQMVWRADTNCSHYPFQGTSPTRWQLLEQPTTSSWARYTADERSRGLLDREVPILHQAATRPVQKFVVDKWSCL